MKSVIIALAVLASLSSVAPASAEWGQRAYVNSDRAASGQSSRPDENNFGKSLNDQGGVRRG